MPAPSLHSFGQIALSLACVGFFATLGVLVGGIGEGLVFTTLTLAAEPALWFVALSLTLHLALGGRALAALTTAFALLAFAVGVRQPQPPDSNHKAPAAITTVVKACAATLGAPQGEVTVATWNVAGSTDARGIARALIDLNADVIAAQEVRGQELWSEVIGYLLTYQESLYNEVVARGASPSPDTALVQGQYIEGMGGAGIGVIVRGGFFGRCGDERFAGVTVPMPAAPERIANAVLTFPVLPGVGAFPFVAVHLDRPAGPSELGGWGARIGRAGRLLAGVSRSLDADTIVIAGDTNTHRTFSRFGGLLAGAGLTEAVAGPSWPARLGPIPALPLYTLDRAFVGPSWTIASVEALRPSLPSDHLAVVARLRPTGEASSSR
ncbi:endonuclease/exonuclease/phosphatase family protein [Myxococcota bacterium]|nr:endonuclease/exonuclease/phosphatase family protein [Myxococcota bacterium]